MQTQCWVLVYLFPIFQPSLPGKRGLYPNDTDPQSRTDVSIFLLLELSEDPELQSVVSGLFLSMCLVTVLGNLLIILAISCDSHLHTPMYFFLSNLSLADIGLTSATIPKMIVDMQSHSRIISYESCLMQMSLSILCV